ncbi:predicted protein [Arabidopsis lyrata subsp. lyrata]|uniref:Predicted protein n=1 Tax=Arabidopsis lyrata subsp. lyrata TaxID=81972 RepID=D7M2B1_ARALL|nr:predicted protein [Arabidopsis lyrata subsp. lyrata]
MHAVRRSKTLRKDLQRKTTENARFRRRRLRVLRQGLRGKKERVKKKRQMRKA